MAMLAALGVENDPRERLEQEYTIASWSVPGQRPRPVVVREPGVPDWWDGDDQASDSFLAAMGIKL